MTERAGHGRLVLDSLGCAKDAWPARYWPRPIGSARSPGRDGPTGTRGRVDHAASSASPTALMASSHVSSGCAARWSRTRCSRSAGVVDRFGVQPRQFGFERALGHGAAPNAA